MKAISLVALILCVTLQAGAQPRISSVDTMRNNSNLTDEEFQWYLDNATRTELVEVLDRDNDGYADGTGKNVAEFIARLRVILICRQEKLQAYQERQQREWLLNYIARRTMAVDSMQNYSNLSDEEFEWYLDNATRAELVEALDRDNDGKADGTGKPVAEFIARMRVIIACRREMLENYERQQALDQFGLIIDQVAPTDI